MAPLNWTILDAVARSLGVSEVALEQWHRRGHVPPLYRVPMIKAGLPLDTDFGELPRRRVKKSIQSAISAGGFLSTPRTEPSE